MPCPGAVIVVGLLIPVGWLQAARQNWQVGFWISTTVLRRCAGPIWCALRRWPCTPSRVATTECRPLWTNTARMLGVTGWSLWWRVHRPLLVRSSLVAGLLVFVDVMKELPAALVLRPL